jgi:hypothetical protein
MASRFPKVDILTRRSMKGGGDRGAKKTTFLQITARTKVRCGEDLEVSKRKIHESDQSRATQAINGYKVRYNSSFVSPVNDLTVAQILQGKTIVGANPSFDAYRLARRWGRAPWNYRLVDVESMAVPLFNLDKPLGLKGLVDKLRDLGYTIPENDHTAEADVITVREVYRSLRQMGENPRREGW